VAGGFTEAADYDRLRPTYPTDALTWIADAVLSGTGGGLVADVAAGTGIFTRRLFPYAVAAGARMVAVEPLPAMRAVLHPSLPTVPVAGAVAEALPIASGRLAAITVAQAFHWFDPTRAFTEFARVLRPAGRVALVWNTRDRSLDWTDQLWGIVGAAEADAPWGPAERQHARALADTRHFGPRHHAAFLHLQHLTPDEVVTRVRGVSHVAMLPDGKRAQLLDSVRDLLATHPDTRGRTELPLPFRTDAYWAERR
jgi:SAM-dependent methyltransferase